MCLVNIEKAFDIVSPTKVLSNLLGVVKSLLYLYKCHGIPSLQIH